MDIMELRPYQSSNDDYRYIFSVIDVFSRKLWSFPLDTQYQTESIDVYRNLKNKLGVYPKCVITDGGPTFGNDFKQYVELIQTIILLREIYLAVLCIERTGRYRKLNTHYFPDVARFGIHFANWQRPWFS